MISVDAEQELRAITQLARGMAKAGGRKQSALIFDVLADRIDAVVDQHGEAAWRRTLREDSHA